MAIQFLVILVVFGILLFLAFKGSNFVLYLLAAAFLGVSGLLILGIRRAILKGEMQGRGSITYRQSSPISFWFGILIFAVAAFFCFFFGLTLLGLAPHWFLALLHSMRSHR